MYAIVNIAGQQYKVEKDQKLFVHRLAGKEGDTVRFDEVLLIDNDKNVLVGEPTIKGAMITGKVLTHPKADKIQVFKKKKRKGYKVLRGHRQYLTEIQIKEIIEKGAAPEARPKAAAKAETGTDTVVKKETEITAPKKSTAAAKATPEKKNTTVKKTPPASKAAAPKKEAAKKPGTTTAKKASGQKTATGSKPAAKKSSGTAAKAAPKKPAAGKTDKK